LMVVKKSLEKLAQKILSAKAPIVGAVQLPNGTTRQGISVEREYQKQP
jgi:hypothetical protein